MLSLAGTAAGCFALAAGFQFILELGQMTEDGWILLQSRVEAVADDDDAEIVQPMRPPLDVRASNPRLDQFGGLSILLDQTVSCGAVDYKGFVQTRNGSSEQHPFHVGVQWCSSGL